MSNQTSSNSHNTKGKPRIDSISGTDYKNDAATNTKQIPPKSMVSRTSAPSTSTTEQLTVMQALFSKCLCSETRWMFSSPNQKIELISLDGIECIALGAVADEHSAKERVELTASLLTTQPSRIINVGYLKDISNHSVISHYQQHSLQKEEKDSNNIVFQKFDKIPEVIPLEAWKGETSSSSNLQQSYDNHTLPLDVGTVIEHIKHKDYLQAIASLEKMLNHTRHSRTKENNQLLEGMILHNIGVVYLLLQQFDDAFPMFEEAVKVKKAAFGDSHPEIAISLVEVGILLFAQEKYEKTLFIFNDALKIRVNAFGSKDPKVAMILNNIACVHFEMGNPLNALGTFKEARGIEQHALGYSQNADLDLLHVATTLSNIGYIQLQIKNYEEARIVLEDALLVQQSVLGDNHRTVKDTLSNLHFTNAFHS